MMMMTDGCLKLRHTISLCLLAGMFLSGCYEEPPDKIYRSVETSISPSSVAIRFSIEPNATGWAKDNELGFVVGSTSEYAANCVLEIDPTAGGEQILAIQADQYCLLQAVSNRKTFCRVRIQNKKTLLFDGYSVLNNRDWLNSGDAIETNWNPNGLFLLDAGRCSIEDAVSRAIEK